MPRHIPFRREPGRDGYIPHAPRASRGIADAARSLKLAGMPARALWLLLQDAFRDWSEDKAPRLGAALAYYTVFSLAPLLVLVIGIAGLAFGDEAVRGEVQNQMRGLLGANGARAIEDMIAGARRPESGTAASIVGMVLLMVGASGVFGQLQDALNTVWEVEPTSGRGVWGIIKDRFLSITMVLGTGFLLLVSLVLSALVSAASHRLGLSNGLTLAAHLLDVVTSFAVVTMLFALIFKLLPDAVIAWRDVWLGAAMTSLLFVVGKTALGLYLGYADVGSTYGAAGSLIVVLVWVYYAAQIFLYGAELTQAYANRYGSRMTAREEARRRAAAPPQRAADLFRHA